MFRFQSLREYSGLFYNIADGKTVSLSSVIEGVNVNTSNAEELAERKAELQKQVRQMQQYKTNTTIYD